MKKSWIVAVALVAGLVTVGLLSSELLAQKVKGKTRDITTKQLMKGLVQVNCADLGKALNAAEVNWDDVALKAAVLNELSFNLMDDGRCPDGEWAKGAKAIRENSKGVIEAAAKKDADLAKNAFKSLTAEGCGTCHKAHKGK